MRWEIIAAYAAGLFLVGGAGAMIGGLVGFGALLYRNDFWSWAAGFSGSALAYLIGKTLFGWLGVEFAWYAYLLCMLPVILNDGTRIGRDGPEFGPEKRHAFGTFCGIVAALLFS